MAAQEEVAEDAYRLSHEILGHSADVRAVCYCPLEGEAPGKHALLTASRDGTACVWEPEGLASRGYLLRKVVKKHTGYVSALCVIPKDEAAGRENTLFATGGQDNTILVHSLKDNIQEPLQRYTGHQGLISCIIYQHGNLISASWDSSVRVWRGGGECDVLDAHKPAVWTVAGLFNVDNSKRILSGGADKVIRLWEVETKICIQEYKGHTDVVRDVKIASKDAFFSAANDCTIRQWNLHTGLCLHQLHGHEAFVYSLCMFPGRGGDEFVSSGEDKTIRVWKGGVCIQVVPVPALSVWSVAYLGSGDIVSGSSDGVARIFTRAPSRVAPPKELEVYDGKVVQLRATSQENAIDISKLPGPEALSKPGSAKGDNLIINNNGNAEVYQWSEDDSQWILIGNAMSKVPDKINVYKGKEYDYVFDIELDEGSPSKRQLRLPYNKSMDPYFAAEDFLSTNHLPSYYLDQVAEFIINNAGEFQGTMQGATQGDPFTGGSRYIPGSGGGAGGVASDPFTGGSRYQPEAGGGGGAVGMGNGGGADPFTGGSSYRPAEFTSNQQPEVNVSFKGLPPTNSFFPMGGFKLFTSSQEYYDKVLSKIMEFNSSVGEDVQFSEAQLQRLKGLGIALSTGFPVEAQDMDDVVGMMLRWPPQYTFPGLDLIRLVLTTSLGSAHFIGDAEKGLGFLKSLVDYANDQSHLKNGVPALRAMANFFAHDVGTLVMHVHRTWVLETLLDLFESTNRTLQISISTIVLNFCHYYYKSGSGRDPVGVKECVLFLTKILSSSYDQEAKFRALIAMGTLVLADKSLVNSSVPLEDVCNIVRPLVGTADPAKVGQCAECLLQVLKH